MLFLKFVFRVAATLEEAEEGELRGGFRAQMSDLMMDNEQILKPGIGGGQAEVNPFAQVHLASSFNTSNKNIQITWCSQLVKEFLNCREPSLTALGHFIILKAL
eukprot:g29518.t1